MSDKSRGGPKGIDWAAAREFWKADPTRSFMDVARQFGCADRTVRERATKEGWNDEARGRDNVIAFRAKRFETAARALQPPGPQPPVQTDVDAEESPEDGLVGHAALAREMVAVCRSGLREVRKTAWRSLRGKAEATKIYVESGEKAINLARTVEGLVAGQPSAKPAVDETIEEGKKYAVVVDVPKTA